MYLTSYPIIESFAFSLTFGIAARLLGTVSASGLAGGVAIGGSIYYFGGWPAFTVLGVFFSLGSALTRAGYARKQALGAAQADRGARGARHAAANCTAGLILALAYKLSGSNPLAGAAFVASFATAAADTAGSEAGPVWGKRAFLPINFRSVPPGTPGAVSLAGTAVSLLAACLIASVGRLVGLVDSTPLTLIVALSGFSGALLESLLGSFAKVEQKLGNEGMNLLNTFSGAAICLVLGWLSGRP